MSKERKNNRTIEELEQDFWEKPTNFPTSLIKDVFLLRKKNLDAFNANDIRILISQNIGLKYLIPKAIDIIKEDILHEAFYYPGDLLSSILNVDNGYWSKNSDELNLFISILKESKPKIKHDKDSDEVDDELVNSVDKFLSRY